jgi:hypothetical protein
MATDRPASACRSSLAPRGLILSEQSEQTGSVRSLLRERLSLGRSAPVHSRPERLSSAHSWPARLSSAHSRPERLALVRSVPVRRQNCPVPGARSGPVRRLPGRGEKLPRERRWRERHGSFGAGLKPARDQSVVCRISQFTSHSYRRGVTHQIAVVHTVREPNMSPQCNIITYCPAMPQAKVACCASFTLE